MKSRVAIAHDYLTQRGGAERVVLSFLKMFPQAKLVTSVYEPTQTYPEFQQYRVETSLLNRIPLIRKDPRRAFPLLATAWSSLRVADTDLVICSSSGWSHGIRSSAFKVVYCHNPARWLYQPKEYNVGISKAARLALAVSTPALKHWDGLHAAAADVYLANSTVVRDRIHRVYGIEAQILHPPVALDVTGERRVVEGITPGFLLTVGRPRGYKNTEAVCAAIATQPRWSLVVVGGLPAGTSSKNITGLTDLSDAELRWLYANCSALIAVGREDFGLTIPEVALFGKPVVAWRSGGYLDTVVEGVNGCFIDTPDPREIVAGIRQLGSMDLSADDIIAYAERFKEPAFQAALGTLLRDYGCDL